MRAPAAQASGRTESCTLCEPWSAYKAFRLGLLNRVVPVLREDGRFVPNPLVITDRWIDEHGQIADYQAVGRDITARKLAEESLQSANRELAQLKDRLQAQNTYLQEELTASESVGDIICRSQIMRQMLAQAQLGEAEPPKESTPFYRLQLELSAQAIIEGLRACQWKLRPAARLLGIRPTKLRYDLKEFLGQELARSGGRAADVAKGLDVPLEVLQRKAEDLGLEEINREPTP